MNREDLIKDDMEVELRCYYFPEDSGFSSLGTYPLKDTLNVIKNSVNTIPEECYNFSIKAFEGSNNRLYSCFMEDGEIYVLKANDIDMITSLELFNIIGYIPPSNYGEKYPDKLKSC